MANGLIPLMLTSADLAACHTSTSRAHRRNLSDATPVLKLSKPPMRSALKRQSQQTPLYLPNIPRTSTEWKRAIADIKQHHLMRRYRACSARCNEILSNLKSTSMVEPAYMIYLNFYAATSLEMCARPLAPASAYRLSLLQQARSHYERTAALLQAAEEVAATQSRSSSAASSLSYPHSPSSSVSSRAWSPDCGTSTPTSSNSRKSSLVLEPRKRHQKKKVSFELPRDKSQWTFTLPEPVVRPDSPTLGFDDEYFAAGALRQELPDLPTKRSPRHEIEMPTYPPPSMPSISEREELSPTETESTATDDSCEDYPFFRTHYFSDRETVRSLARYCDTLSGLKTQVACHLRALNDALAEDVRQQEDRDAAAEVTDAVSFAATAINRLSLHSAGRSRSGSHTSISLDRSSSSMSFTSSCSGGDNELDEMKRKDRQVRIDKLRMSGWKRKRFDASRYEQLCDAVMEELNNQA
ncbi:hypothetical protein BD289DRAFT_459652 [Coniella lustricola]|uniref:Uncharacterized protein n=1 Tax=Coniella lustricola TaxID=2025994 RepID=A0A2T3ADL9_9PEZI|nr:hypothetical protein BD289DRAFT_459652 [Coniella lustricola]